MTDLKRAAFKGGVFTFGAQGIQFICQLASISILARLLSPDDFGMVGMLSSVLALLHLLRDFGLTATIVQSPTITQSQLNFLFRLSLFIGLVMLVVGSLAGYGLSWFVDDPRIALIAPVYGCMFLVGSLGTVPLGLLRRRLQFAKISIRDLTSFFCGVSAAIIVAYCRGGYWSLVTMSATSTTVNVLFSWLAARWLPTLETAKITDSLSLLKFGGTFTLSEVANYLSQNLDNLLIGKIWGLESLGFYTRAYSLMLAPLNQIMGPIGTVMIPVLSRINEDPHRHANWILRMFTIFLLVSAPLAAFLILTSSDLIKLLLGEGWEVTANIFSWLALSLFAKPVASLVYWFFVTSGDVRIMLKWTAANAFLTILAIIIGVIWGPVAVAGAYSATGFLIRTPVAFYYAAQTGRIRFSEFTRPYLIGMAWFSAWLAADWGISVALTMMEFSASLRIVSLGLFTLIGMAVLLRFTKRGQTMLTEFKSILQLRAVVKT